MPRTRAEAGIGDGDGMARVKDRALAAIVASNLLTLAMAIWQGWGLLHVLWPFWIQSVIIGAYAARRIFLLERFCTGGLKVNGREVAPVRSTAIGSALFFMAHFGFFHFVYFLFLVSLSVLSIIGVVPMLAGTDAASGITVALRPADAGIFVVLGLAFWQSHRLSHREHVRADLAGTPQRGRLMLVPYLRIIPMHATLLTGAWLSGGAALWLFIVLKTVADAGMHVAEHRMLGAHASREAGSTSAAGPEG